MENTVAERKLSHLAKVKLLKAELAFEAKSIQHESACVLLLLHVVQTTFLKGLVYSIS